MLTSTQDPATEAYYADVLKRIFDVPSAKGAGATRATRDRNKIVSGGRFVALNGDNNSPTTARAWDCNGVLGPGLTTIADVLAGYAAEAAAMTATGGKPPDIANAWLNAATGEFSRQMEIASRLKISEIREQDALWKRQGSPGGGYF